MSDFKKGDIIVTQTGMLGVFFKGYGETAKVYLSKELITLAVTSHLPNQIRQFDTICHEVENKHKGMIVFFLPTFDLREYFNH